MDTCLVGYLEGQPVACGAFKPWSEDAAEVKRVAAKYLTKDQVAILIVGKKEDILKGHPNHAVKLTDLSKGPLVDVPLRDPLTMQPMGK